MNEAKNLTEMKMVRRTQGWKTRNAFLKGKLKCEKRRLNRLEELNAPKCILDNSERLINEYASRLLLWWLIAKG
jgi:hypothetical protein